MAVDFDGPPIYDELTKNSKDYISDIWVAWITNFGQTLVEYLTQFGIFVPNVNLSQRNSIRNPKLGQFVYNTDTNTLQVWQIKAGNAAWRDVTTTP